MSTTAPRSGSPRGFASVTAGTPGSVAAYRVFKDTSIQGTNPVANVRPVIVSNAGATEPVYVLMNFAVDGQAADASTWAFKVLAGTSVDISMGGLLNIWSVSLYMAGGNYTDVVVWGFHK